MDLPKCSLMARFIDWAKRLSLVAMDKILKMFISCYLQIRI